MKIVCGPAVCIECRLFVWLAKAENGKGLCWRDRDGRKHDCKGEA